MNKSTKMWIIIMNLVTIFVIYLIDKNFDRDKFIKECQTSKPCICKCNN